ncbi:MAG: hypothetical protein M1819_003245 [Sarea resinae]|nr:MAG: hypothetical protein M1819_003245 [Sarea resinae]
MSFGYSIGDIITAAQLARKIRKEFVDAPDEYKAIRDDVNSLRIVLESIDDTQSEQEITDEQERELATISTGCFNVLSELDQVLDRYRALDTDPSSLGAKSRKVWKKLRWEPNDIRDLRSRITSNVNLLNAFNGSLNNKLSLAAKQGVDRLNRTEDDQHCRTIVDWLSPLDFSGQQTDFVNRRERGTGQWFLESPEFKALRDGAEGTLFCPGIPGAGKTIVASLVIDELWNHLQGHEDYGLAYIYCGYKRHEEQKYVDLIASLLKQIVHGRHSLPSELVTLYQQHSRKGTRPNADDILAILYSVLDDYSKVFIVVDALDECGNTDGSRNRLLSEMLRLQARTKAQAKLLATSRFIPDIVQAFEGCLSIEIRAQEEDVRQYLDSQMSLLPSFVSRMPDLRDMIKAEIVKAVDGMFLLALLHLNSLTDKITPSAIKQSLLKLPKGSRALDLAYKEAIERIEGQQPGFVEIAKQAFSWITYAERPLTTLEFQHALSVVVGQTELDEDNVPDVEDVLSACAGLLIVDQESNIIRMVHYTTQEYFERIRESWIPNAQAYITSACLTYQMFDMFSHRDPRLPSDPFFDRLRHYKLMKYAANYWGCHARQSPSYAVKDLILRFLKDVPKLSFSLGVLISGQSSYLFTLKVVASGMIVAAIFGLKDIIILLLDNGLDPDCKGSGSRGQLGSTPLIEAAYAGHKAIVELLLEREDVVADRANRTGLTPLIAAAESGHESIVELLLERKDVVADKANKSGQTPLIAAAKRGHESIVKLLVERDDVKANRADDTSLTPLIAAARGGYESIVELLVKRKDVVADRADSKGMTPLAWATRGGHAAMVELLIEKARAHAPLSHGSDIIHLAFMAGKSERFPVSSYQPSWIYSPRPCRVTGQASVHRLFDR